jgi:DNA invertase Pin-like site-specific DNA recombinase
MSRKATPSPVERKTALCYIRLSMTRNESDKLSPERQRANCLAYCESRGWIPEIYEDVDGHKTGTKENNRPGWLALKARLDAPDIAALVANDLSRLHRKGYRMGQLMEMCEEYGIELVTAANRHSFDFTSITGKMWLMIEAQFNEFYAADIARKQIDNVIYRRSIGKTVGIPPFGTVRDHKGYLMLTPRGVWLMPDGSFLVGTKGDPAPHENAVWRGYSDCAERILTVYAAGNNGIDNIAHIVNKEGWAFRDRNNKPRPIMGDDIRRVVGNWREYAGVLTGGRAKDKNASMIDEPVGVLYETGRAVFDLELLRKVAEIQETRSITTLRAPGSQQTAHIYPLTNLVYCAHCEQKAQENNDPRLRSRLSGWNRRGVLRYRHAEARACGVHNRSVPIEILDRDFERLIKLLTIREDALPLLTELAIQSEQGGSQALSDDDFEEQRNLAVAKLRRKLENSRYLFEDGDLTREEYLRRKQQFEREIAHWESRTTETQKVAMELAMCVDAVNKLAQLWDMSSDEDKQGMARNLFEYIVYDLDTRHITDFRLKPWADRFLMLRTTLYKSETPDSGNNKTSDSGDSDESGNDKTPDGTEVSSTQPCCAPMGLSGHIRIQRARRCAAGLSRTLSPFAGSCAA